MWPNFDNYIYWKYCQRKNFSLVLTMTLLLYLKNNWIETRQLCHIYVIMSAGQTTLPSSFHHSLKVCQSNLRWQRPHRHQMSSVHHCLRTLQVRLFKATYFNPKFGTNICLLIQSNHTMLNLVWKWLMAYYAKDNNSQLIHVSSGLS